MKSRRSLWTSSAGSIAVSVFIGLGTILLLTALFSALTYTLLESLDFAPAFSVISLAAGGYFSGYICGKHRRTKGLINGIICGFMIYAVIFIAGAAVISSAVPLKKLLLLITVGGAGGVYGVNSKRPPYLRE